MQNHEHDIADIFWEQKTLFFLVFMGVITVTYAILFIVDFLPEKPQVDTEAVETVKAEEIEEIGQEEQVQEVEAPVVTDIPVSTVTRDEDEAAVENVPVKAKTTQAPALTSEDVLPVSIVFDSLDNKRVNVLNPNSTTIAALDNALLSGVVRHPESANFGENGTMFLFGHSSYLPNVINKNFQAFNGIQKLTWGDKVRVFSSKAEYVYRVDRVYQVKASNADVQIEYGEAKLTLATCNSFGSKDDRYIVEATLIETNTL